MGTTTPDASSMLEITSTTKGFLMPRMTTAERTAIATPANGLQVYDTTTNTQWFYNGTVWVEYEKNAKALNFIKKQYKKSKLQFIVGILYLNIWYLLFNI